MISYKCEGMSELSNHIAKCHSKLSNRKKLNSDAIIIIDKWIQDNFNSGGSLTGGWQPLNKATVKAKGNSKILHDTGKLKSNWKHISDGSMGKIESKTDYGAVHDEGSKNVPKRQIIPSEEHVIKQLINLFEKFIKGSIK